MTDGTIHSSSRYKYRFLFIFFFCLLFSLHWQQVPVLLKLVIQDKKVKHSTGDRHKQQEALLYKIYYIPGILLKIFLIKGHSTACEMILFSFQKSFIKQFKNTKIAKMQSKSLLQHLNWHPPFLHPAGFPHLNETSWCFVPVRVHYCDSAACEDFKFFPETDFELNNCYLQNIVWKI